MRARRPPHRRGAGGEPGDPRQGQSERVRRRHAPRPGQAQPALALQARVRARGVRQPRREAARLHAHFGHHRLHRLLALEHQLPHRLRRLGLLPAALRGGHPPARRPGGARDGRGRGPLDHPPGAGGHLGVPGHVRRPPRLPSDPAHARPRRAGPGPTVQRPTRSQEHRVRAGRDPLPRTLPARAAQDARAAAPLLLAARCAAAPLVDPRCQVARRARLHPQGRQDRRRDGHRGRGDDQAGRAPVRRGGRGDEDSGARWRPDGDPADDHGGRQGGPHDLDGGRVPGGPARAARVRRRRPALPLPHLALGARDGRGRRRR
mmetsp:Transcript_22546/g.52227  ORF Transcript_22546/g.52227 Transcript_22546/m.52227 type:complete len:319 (-) Transcript_22546:1800-2756(-)